MIKDDPNQPASLECVLLRVDCVRDGLGEGNRISQIYFFFDILTTHNDHPIHVKDVLGDTYVCFTLFGHLVSGGGGGGGSQGAGAQPACAIFHPGQLKNRSFRNQIFGYYDHLK